MLLVKLNKNSADPNKSLEIRFKYSEEYVSRIRQIPDSMWNPEGECWSMSDLVIDSLEKEFKGELVYVTPKWEITGETPPDYAKLYNHVPDKVLPLKPPYSPYPFQVFGSNFLVEQAKKFGFAILLDDMGLGKTLTSIHAYLLLDDEVDLLQYDIPVLVVCKSSLKYQWVVDGVEKFTDSTSVVIDGTKSKRKKIYSNIKANPGEYEFVIINYELIREDIDILKDLPIGLIIGDEAHKIRNHETKSNKTFRQLDSKYLFLLTGSPINGRCEDIFGLAAAKDDTFFGDWKQFSKEYLRLRRTQYGTVEVFGYRNLDTLKDKIDNVALRRTENEVDLQMPILTPPQNIYMDMTPEQKAIDKLLKEEMVELSQELDLASQIEDANEKQKAVEGLKNAILGVNMLRMGAADSSELFTLSNSPMVRKKYATKVKFKSSSKLDYLKEQVQEIIESGHKVVIFTKFETMTRIIARELTKLKITDVVTFTGKMNAQDKESARISFKTQSNVGCFIGTNAAAEGLNLQEAKYLINYDLDQDIGINDQRNKRIRRLDSTFDRVYVYNYICRDSIDEAILKSLERKEDLFSFLIENDSAKSKELKAGCN